MRPIDRMWPALPLMTLGLAVLVAFVGVLAAPGESDTDRIDETVQRFARAAQERRGEDACALLTPAARQRIAARVQTLGCAATVRSFGIGQDAGRLRRARVIGARIGAARATVAREQLLLPPDEPYGRGLVLERAGENWRIAAFE